MKRIFTLAVIIAVYSSISAQAYDPVEWSLLENATYNEENKVLTLAPDIDEGAVSYGIDASYLGDGVTGTYTLSLEEEGQVDEGQELFIGMVVANEQVEWEEMDFALKYNGASLFFYQRGELIHEMDQEVPATIQLSLLDALLSFSVDEIPLAEFDVAGENRYRLQIATDDAQVSMVVGVERDGDGDEGDGGVPGDEEPIDLEPEGPEDPLLIGHGPSSLPNYQHSTTYSRNGSVTSENRVYYDKLGRDWQRLSKNMETNEILAVENKYDNLGRHHITSLPFSTYTSDFAYKQDLFLYTSEGKMAVSDDKGTLGWYYSDNNNEDPLVASSGYPYRQTSYFGKGPEVAKRSLPGATFRMGSGNEKELTREYLTDASVLPQNILPEGESELLVQEQEGNAGEKTVIYTGRAIRVTKSGVGEICDEGVRVKIEYFDDQRRLVKVVPPEAYDCDFSGEGATTIDAQVHPVSFLSMMSNASQTVHTQSLPAYADDVNRREFRVGYKSIGHCLPYKHFRYSYDYSVTSGSNDEPCQYTPVTVDGSTYQRHYSPPSPCLYDDASGATTTNSGAIDGKIIFGLYERPGCLDEEDLPSIDKVYGYRFDVKVYGVKPSGSEALVSNDEVRIRIDYYLEDIQSTGGPAYPSFFQMEGFYVSRQNAFDLGLVYDYELSVVQSHDGQDVFGQLSEEGFDIDDFTAIRVEVANFQEALNFDPYIKWEDQVYGSADPTSYLFDAITSLDIYTELEERPKSTEPFVNGNCEHFVYNRKDEVVKSYTPDVGIVRYIYDSQGRLRFSQNDKQYGHGSFFYLNYDHNGRVVESGEYIVPYLPGFNKILFDAGGEYSPQLTLNAGDVLASSVVDQQDPIPDADSREATYYRYDEATGDVPASSSLYAQNFNEGKLVKSWNAERTTWYGYDLYGRLKWMVQDLGTPLGVKTMAYYYNSADQLSEIAYQREVAAERLHHHFVYNHNGQLKKVVTTTNGFQNYTERAKYEYYDHGPLKRTVLAQGMQGLDYLYNIQGMLASINDPRLGEHDPGQDGMPDGKRYAASDLFGLSLEYNNNMMVQRQTWQADTEHGLEFEDEMLGYQYSYNAHGELTQAKFSTLAYTAPNNYSSTDLDDYQVDYTYDKNGNIGTLQRNGYAAVGLAMDDLTYAYDLNSSGLKNNNKLMQVTDATTASVYADDFKTQTASSNYSYNAIGQMTEDVAEDRAYSYNVQGLIQSVSERTSSSGAVGSTLYAYTYNEAGQKQSQTFYDGSGNKTKALYYVYDASGMLMAVHEELVNMAPHLEPGAPPPPPTTTLSLLSQPLHGMARIGALNHSGDRAQYEIKDHLGNIRMVLAGQKHAGIETHDFSFDGPQPDQGSVPVAENGYSSYLNTDDRVEVSNDEWLYLHLNLQANTTYRISGEYGEITGVGTGLRLGIYDVAAGQMLLAPITVEDGNNSFEFTTNAAGVYHAKFFFAAPATEPVQYWIDDFVVQKLPDITSVTDYYPFGMPMPGRRYTSGAGAYRHGYQGEFAEDDENGFVNFDLRQFDTRLGRWMVPDPMGQYMSSYLGMGNDPVNMIDPTGGVSYYNSLCGCEWDTEWGGYNPAVHHEDMVGVGGLPAAYGGFGSLQESMEAMMGDIELYANLGWRGELSAANRKFYGGAEAAGMSDLHYSSKHKGWGSWEDTYSKRTYEKGGAKVAVYDVTATFNRSRGSVGMRAYPSPLAGVADNIRNAEEWKGVTNPFKGAEAIYIDRGVQFVGAEFDEGVFFILAGKEKGTFKRYYEQAGGVSTEASMGVELGRIDMFGTSSDNFQANFLYGERDKGWIGGVPLLMGFDAGVAVSHSVTPSGYILISSGVQLGLGVTPFQAVLGANRGVISREP